MTNTNEAAQRVSAFLTEWERLGNKHNHLMTLHGNRFQLLASDLRTLAGVVAEEPPFLWFLKDDRMWHVGCGKEVIYDRATFGLLCECGRGSS